MNLDSVISDYRHRVRTVFHREPQREPNRWRRHRIGGKEWQVTQPVTFTPYAAVQPCSARCRFCSENLREQSVGRHASLLRPGADYFAQLQYALQELEGLPLSYSLSGLEMTDDRDWFLSLLTRLDRHGAVSPVEQRVLYSNGAGLVSLGADPVLREALQRFSFSWVELSRHHQDEVSNQTIMRFRDNVAVRTNAAFIQVVGELQAITDVKLVCIVQAGGVDSLAALRDYLNWACSLGVRHVIFRELSLLDDRYRHNATFRYVDGARVSVAGLLKAYLEDEGQRAVTLQQSTHGYYFTNLMVEDSGLHITFESSDYSVLHDKHDSGRIYKLVFHANGNLGADWSPQRHVLLSTSEELLCHGQ